MDCKNYRNKTNIAFSCMVAAFIYFSSFCGALANEDFLGIGETGKAKSLEITVTKVATATDWINSPQKGYKYLVVSIHAKNFSSKEKSINVDDFQFMNEDIGHNDGYARSTGVKAEPPVFGGKSIASGETFDGSIVFAVPENMTTMELQYRPGYNPKQLQFKLDTVAK